MVAELARGDFEDLVAEGLKPTLDDFDRLNLLALRLEAGAETTPASAPRIGWAGDVPFHEPTAAAVLWLNEFADRAAEDVETRRTFYFFALAHGRDPAAFRGLEQPDAIRRAITAWARELPCTTEEMSRACHYAAWGFDDAVPAETERRKAYLHRKNTTAAEENMRRLERTMASAAAATGFSYADLLAQTPSRLNAMIVASEIENGMSVSRDVAKMQIDYSTTLAEIRARLVREKAHDGK